MIKRQVGKGLQLPAADVNKIDDYSEDNLQLFAQDCGFSGCYLSGGTVQADSPVSWDVILKAVTKGRDSNGDRIYVSADETIDMEPSGDPGAGNEVYMSAFIAYSQTATEADVDGDGIAYYKNYADGYAITVVEGTVALLGAAVKPGIPAGSLSVCDVLVTDTIFTRGTILLGDIDVSRQAAFAWPEEFDEITNEGVYQGDDTTESTDKDTGCMILEGGLGVEKRINAGGKIATASQLESSIITGTAPLVVASTTKVANLNVEQVDGCDVETILTDSTDKIPRSDAVYDALGQTRNYILNGAMQVAQEQATVSIVGDGTAQEEYVCDGCKYEQLTAIGDVTVAQIDEATAGFSYPAGFNYMQKFSVDIIDGAIGATEYSYYTLPIEGYDYVSIKDKTVTFGIWVRSSKTGTFCFAIQNNGEDRTYVVESSIDDADTLEYKTVTVTLDQVGGTEDYTNGLGLTIRLVLAAGSNLHTTADAWQSTDDVATANQDNWLDNVANDFYITGVSLNEGSVALPFQHEEYSDVLRKCKRRYQKSYIRGATGPIVNYIGFSSQLPVQMRTAPTVRFGADVTYASTVDNAGAGAIAMTAGGVSSDGVVVIYDAILVGNLTGAWWKSFYELNARF